MDYPIIVYRLSDEDGGGFLGCAPDLMGCISDGETADEALRNTQLAVLEWLDTAEQRGISIPAPHSKSAIARKEREDLLSALKDLGDSVASLDGRLDELARRIEEIEERIEHSQAWDRFVLITGQGSLDLEPGQRPLHG